MKPLRLLWHLLGLFGLLVLVVVIGAFIHYSSSLARFDSGAIDVYRDFAVSMLETGDPANGMVWAVPVNEDLTVDDVKASLMSIAVEREFLFVNESPFYKGVEAVTGEPCRHIEFLGFCDVRVGKRMADHNNRYTAFMPCTISLVEHEDGSLWLYALNMDLLIHGGWELPPDLKEGATKVAQTMRVMMERAAEGDF